MTDTWILYQTTNNVNGKIYIGVHKLSSTSKSRCYLGSGLALKSAIEKYGRKNFNRITLAQFSCGKEAYKAEYQMVNEDFIKRPDTYNISLGGSGAVRLTADMKNKLSIASTGREVSPETRAKISSARKGIKLSEEHIAAIVAANKGNKHTLGRKLTDGHKAKISAGGKGRVFSDEHKAKISAAQSGAKNHNSVAFMINGKYYPTRKFAAEAEKIAPSTVSIRIKNTKPKWSEWRLATEEERCNYMSNKVQ